MRKSRLVVGLSAIAAGALVLGACGGGDAQDTNEPVETNTAQNDDSGNASDQSFSVGISQLVQHPALDAATDGFKQAFIDAGFVEGETITFDVQNANGEQPTAVTIAQNFADSDLDLVLAVATPSAQAAAQAISDKPVVFTAVTDAVEAELVESNEHPGGNVTGTSDMAPIADQFDLLDQIVPGATKIGIVYSSAEVNSEVQVKAAEALAAERGLEIVKQSVSEVKEISQATENLGDVDAIYVPTDNMIVDGIASLVQVAEANKIPVIAAEAGTVEGGAIATLGIDYSKLGHQAGEMALKILVDGADPADMPVEFSKEFSYVVNPDAAERMGVTIPADILDQAEVVE